MDYDVIVIGAGPAGSTVSTFLAQHGRHVLLLEKSRFPREKLCGEFITPECVNLLERLGVYERIFDAGAQFIRSWTLFGPDGRRFDVPMEWITDGHRHAISITRARMDLILLERAREAGVEVREGFHVSPRFHREGGNGTIEGKADGETTERFSAPIVVDASGRNGVFSGASTNLQKAVSRIRRSRLFGCKAHLRGVEGLRDIGELYFFRDGYGGLSNVEDGRTNMCFLTTEETLRSAKGDREKLLDLTMRSNPAARRRLKGAFIDGEWLGTGPINYGRQRSIPGVLAIGDAGAFIDPFTGSGILLALTTGEMAAKLINDSLAQGEGEMEMIANRYHQLHRAQFGLRYRACSLLRSLAFQPLTRDILVSLLSRHQSLLRLITLSTRQRLQSATQYVLLLLTDLLFG